jgi:glycerol-3-phosphate acyltransferase PlsY
MDYLTCAGIGYLLGSISPSYIISKTKRTDMRLSGTKNLGASNTLLHFGALWGALVMLVDISKSYLAVKICNALFGGLPLSGVLSGAFAVIGHIFPFYLKFRGGKGLASFGGLVLATDPYLFLILLSLCLIIALVLDYGCAIALSGAILFPVLVGIRHSSLATFLITAACGACIIYKHTENLRRIRTGEEKGLREFIGKYILHTSDKRTK